MAVQVYGCNHIVIEVTDAKKAVKFYSDVFGLKMLRGGEGAACWIDGSRCQSDQRGAAQTHEEVQARDAAQFPLRLPRSLGE